MKALENRRMQAYHVEGRFYTSSQQEGAVAILLEKYIPDYRIQEGGNFQVKDKGINNGGLDFLVDGEFLEWHPINFAYEGKKDRAKWQLYADLRKEVKDEEDRKAYNSWETEYKTELANNYRARRQDAVDKSGYAGAKVALATNVPELYDFMLKHSDQLPSYKDFRREFNRTIRYVKQFAVNSEKKTEGKEAA
jgi:hypothetical protein